MANFAALVAQFQASGRLPADPIAAESRLIAAVMAIELDRERRGIPPASDAAARLREFAREVDA